MARSWTPTRPLSTISFQEIASLEASQRPARLQTYLEQLAAHTLRITNVSATPELHLTSLGLDSLAAVQIAHCLQKDLNVSISLPALLSCDNLQHLTTMILEQMGTGNASEGPRAFPRGERELPISPGEHRLWFLQQLEPESIAYNEVWAVHIRGSLNPALLQQAVNHIITRHELCRTNYVVQGERVIRRIRPGSNIEFPWFDLQILPKDQQDCAWRKRLSEVAACPFQLASDALLRAALFILGEHEHVIGLVAHHIICDGWSLGIFVNELAATYKALSTG